MYYIKEALFSFVYLLMMSVTGLGVMAIPADWAVVLLGVVCILFYLFINVLIMMKEGQASVKVLHSNDLERKRIIETGEDRPLKRREEYAVWKGYFIGFLICVPLIFLLILHTIIGYSTGEVNKVSGAIAGIIYGVFYVPFKPFITLSSSVATYYLLLYSIPVLIISSGVSYAMGAKKIFRQYEMIAQKQKEIYGD